MGTYRIRRPFGYHVVRGHGKALGVQLMAGLTGQSALKKRVNRIKDGVNRNRE